MTNSNIEMRPERPEDATIITEINRRAFGQQSEANIVELMRRYHPSFDPRFSVVAWEGDRAVGHTLFTPAHIRLMGRTVPAMAPGPVAVLPEHQKQGIGGVMLNYGLELGRREGIELSFLYGHPTYYPRYGYKPCFGGSQMKLDTTKMPEATVKFERMPVRETDVAWLVERHAAELADVDFGWPWGNSINEWTLPSINALVWWTKDGRRAAYTLTAPNGWVSLILADDPELARQVLYTLRTGSIRHHPSGWLAKNALDSAWTTAECKAFDAAMAYELKPGVLALLMQARERGKRLPGEAQFPLPFIF